MHEIEGLAAIVAGMHPQQEKVESARVWLTLLRASTEGSADDVLRLPGRISEFAAALEAGRSDGTPERRSGAIAIAAIAGAYAAAMRGDHAAVAAETRDAREIIGRLPASHPAHSVTAGLLERFESLIDMIDSSSGRTPSVTADTHLERLRVQAAAPGLPAADRAARLHNLGYSEMGYGRDSDRMLDSAVDHLREAVALAGEHDHRQVFYLGNLGLALLARVYSRRSRADRGRALSRWRETRATRRDLTEAIQMLEEARAIAGSDLSAHWSLFSNPLAHAYRHAGQPARGREVALAGLRGHAWNVLLQPDTASTQVAARHAAGDAVDVAVWCLEDNDPASAVTALDAGRALILYAATETRDLAARLEDEGRADLAERWRAAAAGQAEPPGELRREVISAIARIPLDPTGTARVTLDAGSARLLSPPGLEELRAALTALDTDALVYLTPVPNGSGVAVIVPAGGPPTWLTLPELGRGWGADFDAYLTAATRSSRRDLAASAPTGTLDELCDRAWTAAIGPILAQLPDASRIVLIPMGELVRIPWHAARRTVGGRLRYAIEDMTFSYTPSARLLCDVAWRGAPPPAAHCLIVADPDTAGAAADLSSARAEAWAIREAFYPAAGYVGRTPDGSSSSDGPGSREDVLGWLADGGAAGALLHLACHGVVEPGTDSADTSYLLLSGGERLSAEELVSAAGVGRPIALAVLGACSSGVCGRGDDEAFSLSTTLLASNVATVVGTQWSVPDAATSVLMFMFHHFLRQERLAPAEALRRAQLWMISSNRRPPATMPPWLRALIVSPGPASPGEWAAFVHFGR
ncbi:CHAT domain-containing protein [Paractinoplanes lichenicola]|uniref:CHAT domain-containing protein n=1 Tax=Paractinoplanes lichenicola TaxID=2802976 RepID=A0ABS1VU89_9ACTN|nr:CHAT domain-containing protein [Actinoplanes lichenicola]MBL7258044.1 CHAT domain-containing protein [Actinoplanes lichenicola]